MSQTPIDCKRKREGRVRIAGANEKKVGVKLKKNNCILGMPSVCIPVGAHYADG
jgi:hypothetical protein